MVSKTKFKGLKNLKELNLSNNQLTNNDKRLFEELTHLVRLDICQNFNVDRKFIEELKSSIKLLFYFYDIH